MGSGFPQWDLFHADRIRAFPMGCASFWWGSQSWQLGRTNFPEGWEALEQLMDSRDVAADSGDIVAIHVTWWLSMLMDVCSWGRRIGVRPLL